MSPQYRAKTHARSIGKRDRDKADLSLYGHVGGTLVIAGVNRQPVPFPEAPSSTGSSDLRRVLNVRTTPQLGSRATPWDAGTRKELVTLEHSFERCEPRTLCGSGR